MQETGVRSQNAKRPARVYGAIAFYLDHKADVDKYVEETGREWKKIRRARAKISESRARAFAFRRLCLETDSACC